MSSRSFDELRRKAEQLLAARDHQIEDLNRVDLASLAHELAVHQVELEIQNEELRRARSVAEEARDRYLDLFDFAPVGYFTLDEHNRIVEANLVGCRLLQVDRRDLLDKRFTKFVAEEETDGFYFHCRKVLESDARQTFELRLRRADGVPFSAQLDSIKSGEQRLRVVVTDITERKQAEGELRKYRDHLAQLVKERTEELDDANKVLRAEKELRELAHKLVEAQERQRSRIGSELHDQLGQQLTYAMLLVEKAARKPDEKTIVAARSTLQESISAVRNLSSMLSPRLLRGAGLFQALSSLLAEYTTRTQIRVDFDHSVTPADLSEDVALAGYRIVQEALTNVVRHAKASEVKVRLSLVPANLRLTVKDDGVGFALDAVGHSTGLTGMRERALALGGRMSIDTSPGQGTTIVAVLPLH